MKSLKFTLLLLLFVFIYSFACSEHIWEKQSEKSFTPSGNDLYKDFDWFLASRLMDLSKLNIGIAKLENIPTSEVYNDLIYNGFNVFIFNTSWKPTNEDLKEALNKNIYSLIFVKFLKKEEKLEYFKDLLNKGVYMIRLSKKATVRYKIIHTTDGNILDIDEVYPQHTLSIVVQKTATGENFLEIEDNFSSFPSYTWYLHDNKKIPPDTRIKFSY